jgi:hypothetical protein
MSVGALPSENCAILFKKYLAKFEQAALAATAAPAPVSPTPPTPSE